MRTLTLQTGRSFQNDLTLGEDQLAIFDLYLPLQAGCRGWAFRFAGVDLAGGQQWEQGDAGKQGAGDGHEASERERPP